MTRPNRYPYTRSQWEEEITTVYLFGGEEYLKLRKFKNKLTGEEVE